ncbi:hypothetical protein, partial [Candidatus Methylacidiphilum fumarolicum]|uniref:hypothetical protein n=1 Tax=Candidatus Methylacidiphilum fumarolicum TaxID=591154 RepID=UPI0006620601
KDRSTLPLRFSAQVGNVGRTKNLFRSVAITYDATLRKMGLIKLCWLKSKHYQYYSFLFQKRVTFSRLPDNEKTNQ